MAISPLSRLHCYSDCGYWQFSAIEYLGLTTIQLLHSHSCSEKTLVTSQGLLDWLTFCSNLVEVYAVLFCLGSLNSPSLMSCQLIKNIHSQLSFVKLWDLFLLCSFTLLRLRKRHNSQKKRQFNALLLLQAMLDLVLC